MKSIISQTIVILCLIFFLISPTYQVEVVPGLYERAKSKASDVYDYFGDKLLDVESFLGLRTPREKAPLKSPEEPPIVNEPFEEVRALHIYETCPDTAEGIRCELDKVVETIFTRYEDARARRLDARESPKLEKLRESSYDFPSKLKSMEEEGKEKLVEEARKVPEKLKAGKEYLEEKWEEGKEYLSEGKEKLGKKVEEGKEYLEEKLERGKGKLKDLPKEGSSVWETLEEKRKEKLQDVQKKGATFWEKLEEKLEKGTELVKDIFLFNEAKKKVEEGKEFSEKTLKGGKEYLIEGKEKLGKKVEEGKEYLEEKWEEGKEYLSEGKEKVKETGRKIEGKMEEGKEMLKKSGKLARGATEIGKEYLEEKLEGGKEYLGEKLEGGKEFLEEKWEKGKELGEKAKKAVEEKVEEGKEYLVEGVRKTGEKGKEIGEKAKRTVGEKVEEGKEYLEEKWEEGKGRIQGKGKLGRKFQELSPLEMSNIWGEFMDEIPLIFKEAENSLKAKHLRLVDQAKPENRMALVKENERMLREFKSKLSLLESRFDRMFKNIQEMSVSPLQGLNVLATVACEQKETDPHIIERCIDFSTQWNIPDTIPVEKLSSVEKEFCGVWDDWGKALNMTCRCTISPNSPSFDWQAQKRITH